jgi:transposase-like protein
MAQIETQSQTGTGRCAVYGTEKVSTEWGLLSLGYNLKQMYRKNRNKAVYPTLAIRLGGQKELLGMWIEKNEGLKFRVGILNELKNRGVKDILLAAIDRLTGFPDAINAVFQKTEVQLCIVHMVRSSVKYVPYKDRKAVTADLDEVDLHGLVKNFKKMDKAD